MIDHIHNWAKAAAAKYRTARQAKFTLSGPREWEEELRILADADIHTYQDPNRLHPRTGHCGILEDGQVETITTISAMDVDEPNINLLQEPRERRDGTGETQHTLSWIWTMSSYTSNPADEMDNILHSEWAKSRAWVNRSMEEVLLLKEEMCRMLEFLEWKACWWMERQSKRTGLSKELSEGLSVYASSQAALQRSLAEHFRSLWTNPLTNSTVNNGNCEPNGNDPTNEKGSEDDDDEDDNRNGDDDVDANEIEDEDG